MSKPKVISVSNQKGSVGKSTTVYNLGAGFAMNKDDKTLETEVWQNNLCKRRSTEKPNRIKKFINPLNYKTFQWNGRMHSIKCECGYSIGEH